MMWYLRHFIVLAASAFCAISSQEVNAAALQVLHRFPTGAADGKFPVDVSFDGTNLYGTTREGGVGTRGTVYSIGPDGTNYQVLHEFNAAAGGRNPSRGAPVVVGSKVYGATNTGGTLGDGVIYSMDTNGANYQVLKNFDTPIGETPYAGFAVSGSTLFGTTEFGGPNNRGTIYSMNTDGSNFQTLYSFPNGPGTAYSPRGSLTIVGSKVYGTGIGGADNIGSIFSMNLDGTGFQVLHSFLGPITPLEGAFPQGQLALLGSRLYGTATNGGTAPGSNGVIYSMALDGSEFHVLHEFTGGMQGYGPAFDLTTVGSRLIGVTMSGGTGDNGTLFSIHADGTGFEILHDFGTTTATAIRPVGHVSFVNGSLVGVTNYESPLNFGTVYAVPYNAPEPSSFVLAIGGAIGLALMARRRRRG